MSQRRTYGGGYTKLEIKIVSAFNSIYLLIYDGTTQMLKWGFKIKGSVKMKEQTAN